MIEIEGGKMQAMGVHEGKVRVVPGLRLGGSHAGAVREGRSSGVVEHYRAGERAGLGLVRGCAARRR